MAKKKAAPVTAATRALRAAAAEFTNHLYDYEERGGTSVSSRELGVDEHFVIKTLVFEDDHKRPMIVLMHGDLQVSGRALARAVGARSAEPCSPEVAEKHTGYKVGGTSPFGLRKPIPVYAESTIADLEQIYLNGGARGYLVGLSPSALHVLNPTWVRVARER
jgi:Cys-tRNA(Pro) deacylase